MATGLNGRVARLERVLVHSASANTCRACGLRHVQPLTMALVRSIIRVDGGVEVGPASRAPLCLCSSCCGSDNWLARLSHGLSPGSSAA